MIYVWQFWYLLCFDLGISVIYGFNKGFSLQPNLKPILSTQTSNRKPFPPVIPCPPSLLCKQYTFF